VPLAGYIIAFAPLFRVTRVLFLYHYLTPLVFSAAFVLLSLDRIGWTRPGGLREQRASYKGAIIAAIVLFVLFSPVTYGFSVGQYDERLAAFIRSWR